MDAGALTAAAVALGILLLVFRIFLSSKGAKKVRRRGVFHGGTGAGASGAFHEMLSEDKRKAIEIILEEKAEARDAETADDTVKDDGPR